MKIALAISGMPRLYQQGIASWQAILKEYPMDVYIHSWSQGAEKDQQVVQTIVDNFFFLKKIVIDSPMDIDVSLYPDRHWPYTDVYRSLSMWNGISRCFQMIKESSIQYDIIVRGRFDWHVDKLELEYRNALTIPHDPDKFSLKFNYFGYNIHGINDLFVYGPPQLMQKYVNTLELIPHLYKNEKVDYCPENFLAASLIKQNTPVYFQHMSQRLVRG
jgi:hypothetical protein